MNDIINLRQFRKQKKREEKSESAKINRAKFGQSKTQKTISDLTHKHQEKHLDDHKRDKTPGK